MAESIIKYSSLIEDDGGFLKLEKDLENLGKNLTAQVNTWKKSLSVVDVTDTERIKQMETEIIKLRKAYDLLEKQKQKVKVERKKINELSKQELILLEQERNAQSKNRAEAKAIATIKKSQAGSIEQLRARLALVTIAWSKLSEEERINSERGKRLVQSKLDITEELKREERATGDARRNVGNYIEAMREAIAEMKKEKQYLVEKNDALKVEQNKLKENTAEYKYYQKEIENTEKDIQSLNDKLGEADESQKKVAQSTDNSTKFLKRMAIAIGGLSVLRTGAQVLAEFDKNLADLQAVTGLSGKGLDDLKDKSIEFSKRFGTSASSILEAFKLAGSARPELLKNSSAMADLTEKAIILSKASGDDVPTSIKNLTGTLSAFDLPASKASEVMDTLANASQLGAQEIPYLTEAFTKFGAVAQNAGVSVAESASAVEILGQKIPDASTAGTNMKNILIKLQIAAADQGRKFQGLSKELLMLKPKLKDVTFLSKMFGAENINGAQILIQNAEQVDKLSKKYGEQGTALKMAQTNMKTLGESYNKMVSSIQAYFLESANGVNITQKLATALEFFGDNIDSIIKVVGTLITSFITYHTILKGKVIYEMFKASSGVKDFAKNIMSLNQNTKDATEAQKSMGNALKGIGWTALISVVMELGRAVLYMAMGWQHAEDKAKRFEQTISKAEKTSNKLIEKLNKSESKNLAELGDLLNEKKISQAEYNKLVLEEKNKTKETLVTYIDNVKKRKKGYQEQLDLLLKLNKVNKNSAEEMKDSWKLNSKLTGEEFQKLNDVVVEIGRKNKIEGDASWVTMLTGENDAATYSQVIDQLQASISATSKKLYIYNGALYEQNEATKRAKSDLNALNNEFNNNSDSLGKNNIELKANNVDLESQNKLLEENKNLLLEIEQIRSQRKISNLDEEINNQIEQINKNAENFGTIDTSKLNELLQEKMKLQEEFLLKEHNTKKQMLIDEEKATIDVMKADLDRQYQEKNTSKLSAKEKAQLNINYQNELDKINAYEVELKKQTEIKKLKLDEEYSTERDKLAEDYVNQVKGFDEELMQSQRKYLDTIKETEQLKTDEKLIMLENAISEQEAIINKSNGRIKRKELEALRELLSARYLLMRKAIIDEYAYKLSQVEKGSAEEQKLEQEKRNKLLELDNNYKKQLEQNDKDISDSRKKSWSEFTETFKKIMSEVLDRIEQLYQKEVQLAQEKITKQEKAVDVQQERAMNGLSNTLAFEEKERAKAEANKIKAEKRLERVQKIKALYSSYQSYASSGDKNAIGKTLRDFAKLESITASFGDGGIVKDKLPSNGIFQGQSHKGNNGGIKVLVEGDEGIFSTREMKNLGRENFYALKELAGRGSLRSGFFKSKTNNFVKAMPVPVNNAELINETRMVRKAIENFETQKLDVITYTKDLFKVIETTKKDNFITKNIHEIKRPRL
jgi:TP901 family phage tail tape measure protein